MSLYQDTRANPPKLAIKAKVKEVIFDCISPMCDNKFYIRFKKNQEGDFKVSVFNAHCAYAFSNLQLKEPAHALEWLADDEKWEDVVRIINTGVQVVASVQAR